MAYDVVIAGAGASGLMAAVTAANVDMGVAAVAPDKSARIILYCRSGRRANTALETLRAMGYTNVSNYGGLEDAQERLGLPVVTE